ncbi:MAG: Ig-like domain-containing protein [bacterium]|nr:Ig-like domain-containing protein [bacterium]
MQYLFLVLLIAWGGHSIEISCNKGIVIEGIATISSIASGILKSNEPYVVIGSAEENLCYIFGKKDKGSYTLSSADYKIYGKEGDGIGKALAIGDIDGNGNKDLIVGGSKTVYVIKGPINRDIHLEWGEGEPLPATFTDVRAIAIGNVNGDWYDDIIVAENGRCYLFFGCRPLLEIKSLIFEKQDLTGSLAILDLNGDGFSDIAIAGQDKVYIIYGSSSLSGSLTEGLVIEGGDRVAFGNLNNDKYADLLISGTDTTYILYGTSNPKGTTTDKILAGGSSLCLNLDGEGPDEIFISGTLFSGTTAFGSVSCGNLLASFDYDKSGDDDIIIASSTTVFIVFEPYYVKGSVTQQGEPLSDASVKADSLEVMTDSSGSYNLFPLIEGTYTITLEKPHHIFNPASQTLFVDSPKNQDFYASHLFIKGCVTEEQGGGFWCVDLFLSGSAEADGLSDGEGNYIFNLIAPGTYTITPSYSNYLFKPQSATVSLSFDHPNIEFAFVGYQPSISGSVTDGQNPLIATITLTGPETKTITSDNGSYLFNILSFGEYILRPEKPYHIFSPSTRSLTISENSPHFTQNFDGHHLYIAGSVTTPENYSILGATVTVSSVGSITISTDGSFWFDLPEPGTYTIILEMPGFSFNLPASETKFFDYSDPNKTYLFLGKPISVEGTITGDIVQGIEISISGEKEATATTDANGYFSFNLQTPGSYTVKPELIWYGFSPLKWSGNVDFANPNPKVLFSSSRLYLKGSLTTPNSEPLAEATLTITGMYSTETTTDGSGSYYVELLHPGTYTITPERLDWVFLPASFTLDLAKGEQRDFIAGKIPVIATISPTSAPNTETCTLAITGKWFSTQTTARLSNREGSLTAISGTTSISFLFSLYGLKHGTYSLFLTNFYWTGSLTDCFYVSYNLGYILLTPSSFIIPIGGEKTISACVYDSASNPLNLACTWTTTLGTLSSSFGTETTLYSYSDNGAGTITATYGDISKEAFFTVIPATSFKITGPATGTAGKGVIFLALALPLTGSYTQTAIISSSDPKIAGTQTTFRNGTASFTLNFKTSGTQTITITDSSLSEIFGTCTVLVYPDREATLALKGFDVSADIGSLTLFAYLVDQFNNPITGAEINWSILSGTGTISSTSTTVNGTAGAILSSSKAGEIRVEARYEYSLFSTITCKIFPGSTKSIYLYISPNNGVAGGNFTFTILAKDFFANETSDYTGTLSLSGNLEIATQTQFLGSKTLSFILKQAGTFTATATLGTFSAQATFSVSGSSQANSLELVYGTPTALVPFPIDVWVLDVYGNHYNPGTITVYDQNEIFPVSLLQAFDGDKARYSIVFSKVGPIFATITNGEIFRSLFFYVYGNPTASSIWKESLQGTVTVSANTFNQPYRIEITPSSTFPQNNIGISLSICAFGTDNSHLSATGTINISLTYPNTYGHIVDGTNIDERGLVFYTYQNGVWLPIESSCDTERNILYGTTTHLSIFAPAGESLRLKKVPVFPNPYNASHLAKHKGRITFGDSRNPLPSPSTISIFNIAGELLKKEEKITSGKWEWQVGNTASGVYLYRIESQREAIFGKIGVIR